MSAMRSTRCGWRAAQSSDISACGCYIDTMLPLEVGTPLRIGLWLSGSKFEVAAVVRTSHPGVGMGIEFTSLEMPFQQRLQEYLEKIDEGFVARAATEGQ